MNIIEWKDEWSVGVTLLDDQHKEIISNINRLSSDSLPSVRSETVSDILTDITSFAMSHFKAEETLLTQFDYPQLADQKAHHKEFRFKIGQFCVATMDGVDKVPADLLNYLVEWWSEHITVDDIQYKEFLAKRGVN